MSDEQLESWQRLIFQLPKIQPNTMNFTGVQAVFDEEKNLRITMVIQNSTPKDVTFHKLPLFIQGKEEDLVAEGLFEMEDFTVKKTGPVPLGCVYEAAYGIEDMERVVSQR